MTEQPKKVAIVGGGIAGLYTAYRLMHHSKSQLEVHLFESGTRLGGRICSQEVPGIPFRAELGAMRFPKRHQLLVSLIEHMGIKTARFDVGLSRLYVRGRHLTVTELEDGHCHQCRAGIPYSLKERERGKSPGDLVKLAIEEFLNDLTFAQADSVTARNIKMRIREEGIDCVPQYWHKIREVGRYHGIPLHNIGFWNLLQHYLSNEAFEFIHVALGLDSVLGNWSVAVAIPWFLADFGLDTYHMIPGGMERLVKELERDVTQSCQVHKERSVIKIRNTESRWVLQHEGKEGGIEEDSYDNVVLAISRQALEKLEVIGSEEWPPRWSNQVRSHRLFKLFLLYESAWWKEVFESDTGRISTDLPLRQVFYFGPEWMKSHGYPAGEPATEGAQQWGLVMASYSDEHSASFWHSPDLPFESEAAQEEYYGCPYYREPLGRSAEEDSRLLGTIAGDLRARERTVRKVQKLLQEIHDDIDIPDPVIGVFKDWGDSPFGGGWHTWEIGTTPWRLQDRARIADGLFICGEAYSDEQGWIEGALKSVEIFLVSLGVGAPEWWPGSDEDLTAYTKP